MERRLVAILAADLVGYSRLMSEDEAGTLSRLTSVRRDLLEPLITKHRGRVVKLVGDGLLVEFASVVDAVTCAIAWRDSLGEHEALCDEKNPLKFRIGVNVGDVIVDVDDIHGDGVNIAARLEAIAEPGGIYLSSDAYRQVRGKLEAEFEDLGERQLKNIAEPLQVYRVATEAVQSDEANDTADNPFGLDFSLPDHPSIAVLPFTVMSSDPEQLFFSDGIADDITTALSKISGLLVIAPTSLSAPAAKTLDAKQVSREQGVRYVLEGSVRKAGNRVRITTLLIDAVSGAHIWAEKYDRQLDDIFAVQDEITREIIIALDVRLSAGEQARVWSSGTENLDAWLCIREANEFVNRRTSQSVRQARRLGEKALELDPGYAYAWVIIGWTHYHDADVSMGETQESKRETSLAEALSCANKALKLDKTCASAYALSGFCHLEKRNFDSAITMSETAIELAPGNAELLGLAAMVQLKSGRPEHAVDMIKKAMRLYPVYPVWFCSLLGNAHHILGSSEAAISAFEAAIASQKDVLTLHVGLASILGDLGREQAAKRWASEVLRIDPGFSVERYTDGLSYRDPAIRARFKQGLLRAGLPE